MAITAEVLSADQKCACMLVLDTSGSMQGEPIDYLNQGLSAFEKLLKANVLAARRVEVGIITFGKGGVQQIQPFVPARHFNAPQLVADEVTPMGEAVRIALHALRNRKNEYRSMGSQYYRPWLMLLTDGEPTDEGWEQAAAEVKREESQKNLSCFPIGVGNNVNVEKLSLFSRKPPLMLNGLDFEELFMWLSASLERVSASGPGDQVELPSVDSWARLV
jgi:uncharacterized protein YegL